MAKIGVLSDVHGNLEALEAVLEAMNKRDVKKIWCLGDSFGRGPSPAEVFDTLYHNSEFIIEHQAGDWETILRNESEEVMNRLKTGERPESLMRSFSAVTIPTLPWTWEQLKDKREYISNSLFTQRSLKVQNTNYFVWTAHGPLRKDYYMFNVIHRQMSTDQIDSWLKAELEDLYDKDLFVHAHNREYLPTIYATMNHMNTQIAFFGHTHVGRVIVAKYSTDQNRFIRTQEKINEKLTAEIRSEESIHAGIITRKYYDLFTPDRIRVPGETLHRYKQQTIVLPGSVGAPREGMNEATCSVIDTDTEIVELLVIPYDYKKTQKKLIDLKKVPYLAPVVEKIAARLAAG